MVVFSYLLTGLISLSLGSFFTVVLTRPMKGERISNGRSRCPSCRHPLGGRDLVPLISFMLLRGRCRYCHKQIPAVYFLIELITLAAGLLFVWQYGFLVTPGWIFYAIVLLGFILLAFFDFLYLILPDVLTIPLFVIGLVYVWFARPDFFVSGLITAFSLAAFFAILHVVSAGRWMGFGDVKLVFLIGIIFGYPLAIVVVVTAIWAAALVGILFLVKRQATLKTPLPFGTFLSLVSLTAILWGSHTISLTSLFQ